MEPKNLPAALKRFWPEFCAATGPEVELDGVKMARAWAYEILARDQKVEAFLKNLKKAEKPAAEKKKPQTVEDHPTHSPT
jgi:hypothetical protein